MTADVTDEDEVEGVCPRQAVDKFGTIDAFYNNAGVEGEVKADHRLSAGECFAACSTSTWSASSSA